MPAVEDLLVTLALGIAVFAATNVDDLFVLLGFFADPDYRPRQIALGQLAGIALLVTTSVLCALVALVIPGQWLGLIGLAPLGIGLWKLRGVRRGRPEGAEPPRAVGPGGGQALAVGAVTVANGGDNIAVYTPLFATRSAGEVALMVGVFAGMTALWLVVARALLRYPATGPPIRRIGRYALPVVLMGLGILIVAEADTLSLLGSSGTP